MRAAPSSRCSTGDGTGTPTPSNSFIASRCAPAWSKVGLSIRSTRTATSCCKVRWSSCFTTFVTRGEIRIVHLTEQNRRIVNIPRLVWHADHNIGSKDVIAVNLPTRPYEHANPDKYRL